MSAVQQATIALPETHQALKPFDAAPANAMEHLIRAVQELSLAATQERIIEIVRRAARELTQADGATFVLRERDANGSDVCFYAEEDAIAPLWKGHRFPAQSCISGWAMLHREAAVIDDVFADPRIPVEAYSPTFVKSLVMVPIRRVSPIGAIGTYWASRRVPSTGEVELLQALADSTSVAMENVATRAELERRVEARTAELAAAREDLVRANQALIDIGRRKEELTALLVHDIKGPAAGLMLRSQLRLQESDVSDMERRSWASVAAGAEAVSRLAMNLLDIARSEDGAFTAHREPLVVDALFEQLGRLMHPLAEARGQHLILPPPGSGLTLHADREILLRVLQNLVDNAVTHNPRGGAVRVDMDGDEDGLVLAVADEGPGIPVAQRERVFDKYVRLQGSDAPRTGRGLGLSFCRLAVEAHDGRIWAESAGARGTRFCVRLPRAPLH